MVTDDELFSATVTPQGAHFLEIRRLLPTLTFLNRHCFHLLNFSDFAAFRVRGVAAALEAFRAISKRHSGVRFFLVSDRQCQTNHDHATWPLPPRVRPPTRRMSCAKQSHSECPRYSI